MAKQRPNVGNVTSQLSQCISSCAFLVISLQTETYAADGGTYSLSGQASKIRMFEQTGSVTSDA